MSDGVKDSSLEAIDTSVKTNGKYLMPQEQGHEPASWFTGNECAEPSVWCNNRKIHFS